MKNTTITFRLTQQEKDWIFAAAAKRDIPVSQLIREAVRKLNKEDLNDGKRA